MTIPLINLPRNVIRLVTRMMTSAELYNLWSLSKKTKGVVKPLYPKNTHVQRVCNDELVSLILISQMGYTLEKLWIRLDPGRITFTNSFAMATSKFSLFKLPDKAIRHVIQYMNYDELIFLSLLSKRAKDLVESLNVTSTLVSVVITSGITVHISLGTKDHMKFEFFNDDKTRNLPNGMWLMVNNYSEVEEIWRIKGLCIKKWLDRIKTIFHFSEIDYFNFGEESISFDIDTIRDILNSYSGLRPPFFPNCCRDSYSIISSAAGISTPFPLISLPNNVICLVTQMMTSNELFSLWSLSNQTRKTVKPLYTKNSYVQRISNDDLVLFKVLPRQVYIEEDSNGLPETLTFTAPPAMVTSRFSLFNLPNKAIRHVFEFMNFDEIILLSFLSKRSKSIAESLDIKCTFVAIDISSRLIINISIDTKFTVKLEFSNSSTFASPKGTWLLVSEYEKGEEDRGDEHENGDDEGEGEEEGLRIKKVVNSWILKGFSIKKWLDHLKSIFHFSEVNYLDFDEGSITFDKNDFRDVFNCQSRLGLGNNCGPEAYAMEILKTFPTANLSLETNLFESGKPPYELMIQNYDYLSIWSRHQVTITLDDLLTLNSVYIDVSGLSLTEKDVNRFIKNWMRGSNPRMEQMYISFHGDRIIDKNLVLEKSNYVEFSADQKRYFKENDEQTFIVVPVKGGFDISRSDGTKATILFEESDKSLHILVWHPHCIAEKDTDRFQTHRAPFHN